MEVIKKILIFLDSSMERPHSYGWFHITFLILLCITLLLIKKNREKVKVEKVILIVSILSLCLELYKQINFSFNYNNITTWWRYKWYAFPFQFCSTPMYIGVLSAIVKNKKVKDSLYYFLATYGIVGGFITMIYPESCFIDTIGINIQTMVHHAGMVVMGMTVIMCSDLKFNFKSFIKATKVFIVLVVIALLINIFTYYLGIDSGLEMFYISPFHNCSLPILSIINSKLPYILFLIIYLLLFSFGCFVITCIAGKNNKKTNS